MSDRFRRAQIEVTATVADAMRSLDASQAQIVLVVDDQGRLLGTLTDGDLRRALLGGATMTGSVRPHMNPRFTSVTAIADRVEVLEMMEARHILQVPVLDGDGRVVGLHLVHELLASRLRPNRAVVMAGGRGTRLAPLTDQVPKPMLRVAGRPILERIVLHLVGSGIRHIYLSVNHLAETIERHFGDGSGLGCRIEYLREPSPLGTAGALALLPEPPADALVVMNGDLVTQADIGRLIDHHELVGPALTIAVRKYFHQVPFGCVTVSDDAVVAIEEKPTLERVINAGIYVIDPAQLARVPAAQPMTMPELVELVLGAGLRVQAHEIDDDWIDVGRRDELERARGPR